MSKNEERILLYDVNSIPYTMTLQDVLHAYMDVNIVFFDGNKGEAPRVIKKKKDEDVQFVEASGNQLRMDLFPEETDIT